MVSVSPSRRRERHDSRVFQWLCAGAAALGLTGAPSLAAAQDPGGAGAQDGSNHGRPGRGRLEAAKRLFKQGVKLRKDGDLEGALEAFLKSRSEVPSVGNTNNAAYLFERLGRADEALEMHEELLLRFTPELSDDERMKIGPTMVELRKKVGSVDLSLYAQGRIFIDGRARGELPLSKPLWVLGGKRAVRIVAPDHEPLEITVDVPIGETVFINDPLVLLPPPPENPVFVELLGGYAGGGTLGSDAERDCEEGCNASGYILGARGGYRFNFGSASLRHSLVLEVTGGYLLLKLQFSREVGIGGSFLQGSTVVDFHYKLEDELSLRGPFIGTGLSYRLKLGSYLGTTARITVGVLSARTSDPITGTAVTNDAPVDIVVSSQNEVLRSQPLFLMPELGMNAWWDDIYAGISLGIFIVPSKGPRFSHVETGVKSPGCGATTGAGCAPNSGIVAGERAYGPLWIWVPQIAAGHVF
jgi:hypothetical protein